MDKEEKEYIDKKFSEMKDQFFNPDPEQIMAKTKVYYKYQIKWIIVSILVSIAALLVSFYYVGLI